MHPDLSPHLHSDECNVLINKLKECHKVNKIGKFFGYCNEVDNALVKCLRKEREAQRKSNIEKSRAKQARYKDILNSQK